MNYTELSNQVASGELNALKTFIMLKKEFDNLSDALKIVQPLAVDEALKYPEKSFKIDGAIVEKRNAASTWDYSQVEAYAQAKDRLKYIEKIAQAGGGYDNVTSEEIGKAIKIDGKQTIAIKILEK